ncbi:predicted protein [Meyerozyma guilliermondii ATCC 6260]|uniref:Uncharacterized protein n=1 Tax=Meyerozyma guilliermondii (strain ATCC 6260 / CBS 566 / DSM 6381 / JCM 1539 / NBRC 10279 / NRRL Y-324) TaxID=294746 RepID=A5DPL6_PICGU|nr:uncharacterized protein PGUG_05217 [Meyerozyma guilliermondii ATCC 6260]EDK41119.2 predicted protein [Meyerozyma guilliermondii ATCC 6260]
MRLGIILGFCAVAALDISFTNETDEILQRDKSKIQDSLIALRGFLSAHRNESKDLGDHTRPEPASTEVDIFSTLTTISSSTLSSTTFLSSTSSSTSSDPEPALGFSPRDARNNLRAEAKLHISPQFQNHNPNSEPVVPLVYAKPKESWLNVHKNVPSHNEDTTISEETSTILEEEWTAETFWNLPQSTVSSGSVTIEVNKTDSVETTSANFQVYDSLRLQSEYARLQSTVSITTTSNSEPTNPPSAPDQRLWRNSQLNRTRRRRGKAPRKKLQFPRLDWIKSEGTRVKVPSLIPYFLIALLTI